MKANKTSITTKAVINLKPGDVLIGKQGGQSVVEYASDQSSGLLGFLRVKTEHGHLYLEMNKKAKVLSNPKKE